MARRAGLGEGHSRRSAFPWNSVQPRPGLTPLGSLVCRGSVPALLTIGVPLGNALFELQAQLFLSKRAGTVQPPHGHRSDSLIVILYVWDIRYQSEEGRPSDEVIDQFGEGPITEDELPSPATVSSLSRKI